MKILIVEDDLNLSETMKKAMEMDFDVFTASNGKAAKDIASKEYPNVILLDIMLPDIKGYELIKFFKGVNSPIVIMISALEEEETRIRAYEKGADDYMIKPITFLDLKYKLKAISKRISEDNYLIKLGDLKFDQSTNVLTCGNNSIKLQLSQATIFKLLYGKYKKQEVLTKEEILEFDDLKKTMSVRVHTSVSRLRKNISSIGCGKIIVENVYGQGYRLVVFK